MPVTIRAPQAPKSAPPPHGPRPCCGARRSARPSASAPRPGATRRWWWPCGRQTGSTTTRRTARWRACSCRWGVRARWTPVRTPLLRARVHDPLERSHALCCGHGAPLPPQNPCPGPRSLPPGQIPPPQTHTPAPARYGAGGRGARRRQPGGARPAGGRLFGRWEGGFGGGGGMQARLSVLNTSPRALGFWERGCGRSRNRPSSVTGGGGCFVLGPGMPGAERSGANTPVQPGSEIRTLARASRAPQPCGLPLQPQRAAPSPPPPPPIGRTGRASDPARLPSSSYRLGVRSAPLHDLYPAPLSAALAAALAGFDRRLPGFASSGAGLLHGVETRTSAPVRIERRAEDCCRRGLQRAVGGGLPGPVCGCCSSDQLARSHQTECVPQTAECCGPSSLHAPPPPSSRFNSCRAAAGSMAQPHPPPTPTPSVSLEGLYPCGEGAGYAGGIVSAAVDGLRVGEAAVEALTGVRLGMGF
jgi:hypothetical protein